MNIQSVQLSLIFNQLRTFPAQIQTTYVAECLCAFNKFNVFYMILNKFKVNNKDAGILNLGVDNSPNDNYDLAICDENEAYNIALFSNGHIRTKNFNSYNTIEVKDGDYSFDAVLEDENQNILLGLSDGHIRTKNFKSNNITIDNLSNDLKQQIYNTSENDKISILLRKSVKVLFVGNSISQDHATYIPWLLSTLYNGNTTDKIDYTVGIFYIGSHMIKQYAEENWDSLKAQIWSIANNTPIWTITNNVTSLNDALQAADWDIISIQGYFNTGQTDDVTKAVQFVSRLRQQVQNNFKLAYLIHQTYRGDAMFKTILEAAATVIQQNDVNVLFAPGIANEYAKEYFTTSQLSPDSTHNEEGLPCMIGAYECLCEILRVLKSENVILGDTNILTLAIWQTLNIPGPNGTMDEALNTQDNYKKIQKCSIQAFNKAQMLLENLKNSSIYNYVKEFNN